MARPITWAYKQVLIPGPIPLDESTLNTLGAEGWEAVGILTSANVRVILMKRLAQDWP
jgi:hypothetical protein